MLEMLGGAILWVLEVTAWIVGVVVVGLIIASWMFEKVWRGW